MRVKSFCGCFSLKTGVLVMGWCTVIYAILSVIFLAFQFNNDNAGFHDRSGIVRIIAAGMMIGSIVVGFTGGLMVYGVQKKNHGYLFPWIALSTADIMIVGVFSFGFIVLGALSFPLACYLIVTAISLTTLASQVYIWLVVYSYYMHLIVDKYGCAGSCTEVKKVPIESLNIYHHI